VIAKSCIIGIILLLTAFNLKSQNVFKGKVLDSLTREPISYANVFFANTSIGGVTNLNGEFSIQNFPSGKFDVTISFVGYATQQFAVNFSENEYTLTVYLAQQVIQLKEIYVRADTSGWRDNLKLFKRNFIGNTKNASRVEIINPRSIYFFFDPVDRILVAHAKEPVQIENRALGYKLYYQLDNFYLDYQQSKLTYFGIPRLESLTPKDWQEQKRWERERKRAYYGSFGHFIKVLKQNKLMESGFEIFPIYSFPNPERPDEAFLKRRIAYWSERAAIDKSSVALGREGDSLTYYLRLKSMPSSIDSLGSKINSAQNLYAAGSDNVLQYTGKLLVTFREGEESKYAIGRQPMRIQRSVVHFLGKQLLIYDNGYYEDVHDVFLEGYWGWSEKIAELLPLEYNPIDD